MIARVPLIWFAFSMLLLALGLFSQGEPFEPQHLGWSLLLSLPVGLAVLRGGLGEAGHRELQYPSVPLMIVSAWILTVGPSLVFESQEARFFYHYSDASLTLARVFFFGWCLLFVLASRRPVTGMLNARPSLVDFVALSLFTLLLTSYLVRVGMFSSYRSEDHEVAAGSAAAIAQTMGLPLFMQLPPLFLLIVLRMQVRGALFYMVLAGFFGSWVLLFLLGSRTVLAVAVASCLLLCRYLGLRVRANVVLGLGIAMPVLVIMLMVYRNALANSEVDFTSVGQYLSVASEATFSLDRADAQSDAVDLVTSNARVRLWYGQQFCVVIDEWLDQGASLRGTFLSGLLAALPTAIMSDKNALAAELAFEQQLHQTSRFPRIDLAPTPWMQWLFELGILGLLLGPLLYAGLASLIASRIGKTQSFYEVFFWLQIFFSILPAEHTTDWVALAARSALVLALVVGGLARVLSWGSGLLISPRATRSDA